MERTWFPSELPVGAAASYAAGPGPGPGLPRYSESYTILLRPTPILLGTAYPEEQSSAIWHGIGWLPGLPFGSTRAVLSTDDEMEAVEITLAEVCRCGGVISCYRCLFVLTPEPQEEK